MKKLNSFRFPVLFALLFGLVFNLNAQQKTGEASPGLPETEIEAKKETYRQLGIAWPYEDGKSLEVARETIISNANGHPEVLQKQQMIEFETNAATWASTDPQRYAALAKSLGIATSVDPALVNVHHPDYVNSSPEKKSYMLSHPDEYPQIFNAAPVEQITMEDYRAASPEKKAYIDSNPALFKIQDKPSTR